MRVLAIAIAVFAAVAQASLADRKQSGRKLDEEEIENCGVLREQPCKNGCASGLIVDTSHWADLYETISFLLTLGLGPPPRRLDDTVDTVDMIDAAKKKEREPPRLPTYPFEKAGPPLCVPCGQLTQLPCPGEDEWLPKCSQGLVASNLLGYIPYDILAVPLFGAGRRLEGSPLDYWLSSFLSGPDAIPDVLPSIIIDVVVGFNICLPCGGEDQPPCDDGTGNEVGCIGDLVLDKSGFKPVTINFKPFIDNFPIPLPAVARCVRGPE